MRKQFLIGPFLAAYSGAYKYKDGYGKTGEKPDASWLQDRLACRAQRKSKQREIYISRILIATVVALLLVIGIAEMELKSGRSQDLAPREQESVELQQVVQTMQEVLPPPPPRPAIMVTVPDEELLQIDDLDFDAALDLVRSPAALPTPPEIEEAGGEDEREVFAIVEVSPEMIGGVAELARALKYPSIARQAGIEGTVVVKIIVTAEGLPMQPTVLSSPSGVLDEAAVGAVMKQRFKPGRQRGRAVAVEMAIPVRFRLTDDV